MRQQKVHQGLHNFVMALSDGKDRNDQLAQMLGKSIEVLIEQADSIRQLAVICLIYLSSDSFISDAAKIASNLGAGEEALREFAKQKFGHILDEFKSES